MRRVRGSGFFRARREHDARECLCRKASRPWRAPRCARRRAGAGPWPSPHRLEPFCEEFVVRIGRRDPRTFSKPSPAHLEEQANYPGVRRRKKQEKISASGFSRMEASKRDLSSVGRNCASNFTRDRRKGKVAMNPEQKEVMKRIKKSDAKLRVARSMPRYSLDAAKAPNAYVILAAWRKRNTLHRMTLP